jgi:tRNA-splicing ligase RtcB
MSEKDLATLHTWLIEPLEPAVAQAILRLRRAPDVRHVAVMPDVHLANDVCVGTVFSTSRLIYPQAVGGDIGCGMLALRLNAPADLLKNPARAGKILAGLGHAVPPIRRHRRDTLSQPDSIQNAALSHRHLDAIRREEGALQFGTLGGGNHFIELQSDEQDQLWLMIHSGSRAMGQAIRAHHLAGAEPAGSGLKALDASAISGQAYLHDLAWARQFAAANRLAMAEQVVKTLAQICAVYPEWDSLVAIDHNHVVREAHGAQSLWVHRKGAMPAGAGVAGILPGSMASQSFHVEGRGCANALDSSAHGAGRAMSREAARRSISCREVHQQMDGVWYDYRMDDALREEAPAAYKKIAAVLRAQRELVRVIRVLRPLLSYKARNQAR